MTHPPGTARTPAQRRQVQAALGFLSLALVACSPRSNSVTEAALEERANVGVERIAQLLMRSDRSTWSPMSAAPLASDRICFGSDPAPTTEDAVQPEPEQTIELDPTTHEVVWRTAASANAPAQRVVLAHGVAPLLGGETVNCMDDNRNGLIDEPGLCFTLEGDVLRVRLSLVEDGSSTSTLLACAERAVDASSASPADCGPRSDAVAQAALQERASEGLERIATLLVRSDRSTWTPAHSAPMGSGRISFGSDPAPATGDAVEPAQTIALDPDTHEVIWSTAASASAPAQREVLAHGVAPLLAGETADGMDNNRNGLIDEPGLCFSLDGDVLRVFLSLEESASSTTTLEACVETSVMGRPPTLPSAR